jgi:hypothetical protein
MPDKMDLCQIDGLPLIPVTRRGALDVECLGGFLY